MDVFRIAAIGIISAILSVTIKNWRPELAILIAIAASVVIVPTVVGVFGETIKVFEEIISDCGVSTEYFNLVIKLIGISYVTKFAAETCKDCGENAIGAKVELAGKVAVFALCVPVIGAFLNLVKETLNSF